MDHTTRAVLAQTDAEATTNEIARSGHSWTGWTSPVGSSLPMRCTSNASTPTGWSPNSTPPTCWS
jgi:hypothetical protein